MGLVNRVLAHGTLAGEVEAMCATIAANAPLAIKHSVMQTRQIASGAIIVSRSRSRSSSTPQPGASGMRVRPA